MRIVIGVAFDAGVGCSPELLILLVAQSALHALVSPDQREVCLLMVKRLGVQTHDIRIPSQMLIMTASAVRNRVPWLPAVKPRP